MNVRDITDVLDEISRIRDDDEHAHALEDSLYIRVLKEIAAGSANPAALAAEALKAGDIEFSRWYA
jgi:hypothetical protein